MLTTLVFVLAAAPVHVNLPVGGLVPDAARDGATTYVAYGVRPDAFVATLDEVSNTLTEGVKANSLPGTVVTGGERGPKVAAGAGHVHVAWQDPNHAVPRVWYARSANGGKSFASQRNLLTGAAGIDMVSVAARGRNVVVLWLDGRGGEDAENPVSSPIYYAESTDAGNTFGPNTKLQTPFRGTACACCTLDAQFEQDGTLSVLFRTGYRNVRDVWLLQRASGASAFSAVRVSDDKWNLKTCPMDGPRYAAGAGQQVAVWMSDKRVYWAERAGVAFLPRKTLTEGEAKYPEVARNSHGELLALWQAGAALKWGFLPGGASGSFPSSGHRAAIVVGADDRFRIVN